MESRLQAMWETHREHLRRMLIGMTHDMDLTEDLLQETYINARSGIAGYRGGDERAWLSTIARNLFRTHLRSKYGHPETELDPELYADSGHHAGSSNHVTLLALHQAINELPPPLRQALIMKHYGGFDYKEISERQSCPMGTSQYRVWAAIQRLRTLMAAGDLKETKCQLFTPTDMLDYLYSAMPDDQSSSIETHFRECPDCREELRELNEVATALDTFECDYKNMYVLELNEQNGFTVYFTQMARNDLDHETDVLTIPVPTYVTVTHISIQEQDVEFKVLGLDNSNEVIHEAHLPRPLKPGERIDILLVGHDSEEWKSLPENLGGSRWRIKDRLSADGGRELVRINVVRFPAGARLLDTTPSASEVRSGDRLTATWRRLLRPGEVFEYSFEYRLRDQRK